MESVAPCVRGHFAKRWKNGRCAACAAEYVAATREARRLRERKTYSAKAETLKATASRYRARNRAVENERYRRWTQNNPDGAAAKRHKRRCAIIGVDGSISAEEISALKQRQRDRCASCGRSAKLTLDHITPVSRGGKHCVRNAQMLCRPCNSRKSNTDPIVFAQKQGRLL